MIISVFHSLDINASAHEIKNIETIEHDITPRFRQSRFGPKPVVIDKDSTTIELGSINYFTPQHIMIGHINFSNVELEYDVMEAYQTILHQKILIQDFMDEPYEIARRSKKLSDSALRDAELSFMYNIRQLDDVTWSPFDQHSSIKNWIQTSTRSDEINFKIETSIEFIRGTKQNARFDLFYSIESYSSPSVPLNNFHYKQIMNSSVLPNKINIDGSSVIGSSGQVFLFLPDELLPRFFESSEEHQLNLTKVPLTIKLHLELSNSNNKFTRLFKVESGFYMGSPIASNDHSEDYKLSIVLSNNPLIPIKISSLNFVGEIKVTIVLEMKSLFADTSLYAKNEYPFSPNQYLTLMIIPSTIFVYKLVDYVGYREKQNVLARINYDLVEEEFIR